MNILMTNGLNVSVLLLTFLALPACNEKQATQNNTHDLKSSSVTTQAYVKPHAPIYLSYETPVMEVGVEANIPIKISSGKKADDLTISYFVKDAGINLYHARTPVSFGVQEKNQLNSHTLTVMPEAEGEFMIYLTATVTNNAREQSRSFVIPVKVGNVRRQKALKSAGEITTDSTGTPIITMPAVETTD